MAFFCRKARGGPPRTGILICAIAGPVSKLNQISAPSPEKPNFLKAGPLDCIGEISAVRLRNFPLPTWLSQMSNWPSLSATKATNFPSGEISAPPSEPPQSVKREKVGLASGSSRLSAERRPVHTATPTVSTPTAIHGSHVARLFAGAGDAPSGSDAHGSLSSIASISILTSPISRRRCLESFARQRNKSRRIGRGVAAGSADQSGSRSRIFPIVSEVVSPSNGTRPVNIS